MIFNDIAITIFFMVIAQKHRLPNSEAKRLLLAEIARTQGGFFTAAQAASVGFDNANQFLLVKDGRWERVRRGIFRLASEPHGEFDDLHVLALFFRHRDGSPSGVFGLETAASVHGIGDFMPGKIAVLVTLSFRSRATIPPNVDLVRVTDITSQVTVVGGLPLTSPLRTIVDLLQAPERDCEEIRRGFLAARREGLISPDGVKKIGEWAPADVVKQITAWEHQLNSLVKREAE